MKKNILIVDDSALMRRLISDIITSDERFCIGDIAYNGLEAFDLVTLSPQKYDAILLDINMPKMNGIEFLKQLDKLHIKQTVIVVSTLAKEGAKETIQCLEYGAFDFVTKPESFIEAKDDNFRKRIITTLCAALQLDSLVSDSQRKRISMKSVRKHDFVKGSGNRKKIVVLACSTGGPKALQKVIPLLPENLDAPVIVVQHMPEGFTNSLAQRLNDMSKLKVKEAENGDIVEKGFVYIAKGGSQIRIAKISDGYQLLITDEAPRNGLKPCADIMYESLLGANYDAITCVILTGMGGDGTIGIKQLNENENIYVIAQDEATSTVYGMPKVIAEAGLTNEIVALQEVAKAITKNVGVR